MEYVILRVCLMVSDRGLPTAPGILLKAMENYPQGPIDALFSLTLPVPPGNLPILKFQTHPL